jgi:hypothetical protein
LRKSDQCPHIAFNKETTRSPSLSGTTNEALIRFHPGNQDSKLKEHHQNESLAKSDCCNALIARHSRHIYGFWHEHHHANENRARTTYFEASFFTPSNVRTPRDSFHGTRSRSKDLCKASFQGNVLNVPIPNRARPVTRSIQVCIYSLYDKI